MRRLIVALLVLAASVLLALWLHGQGGFVLVAMGDATYQMTLVVFVLLVVGVVVGGYLLLALLREVLGMPGRVHRWVGRRRQNRARGHLVDGLLRLSEGRYPEAEKLLLKDVDHSETPLLHYLAAAVVAQRESALERRDHYLGQADKSAPKAKLAVGLLQAQLQMEAGEWEQALATLSYLYEHQPHHPRLLSLLVSCCRQLKEWERVEALLPDLRRQKVMSEAELQALAQTVAVHRLEAAIREGRPPLIQVWEDLPKALRDDVELLLIYANGLSLQGQDDEAERLLRSRLQKDWNPRLLQRYGELKTTAPDKAFAQLEKWLRERPDDPALLYAAGRQALRAKLWGRARSYLEASAARAARPETFQLLGALLEQMGEPEQAHQCYLKALEASAGGSPWQSLGLREAPQLSSQVEEKE